MLKIIFTFLIFVFSFLFPSQLFADENYVIEHFRSEITINEDTSLTVKETINVNFKLPRHGIYRIIPVVYTNRGKTINSRVKVESITDEDGIRYNYEKTRLKQSLSLKIGDADIKIYGPKTYVITYKVYDVLQKYNDSFELYWNVTGHEWDTEILSAESIVTSSHAQIEKIDCFSGIYGSVEDSCISDQKEEEAVFRVYDPIEPGEDFTIVADLSTVNTLNPPTKIQTYLQTILNNWGYAIAPLPLYLIFYYWYKRGRDDKYSGANIYYKEDSQKVETKSLFAREHLPFVYHPIDGLTPAEVGVIVDEKVDIEDVLSEILELGRLGFIEIRKIVKKKLFKDETEYAFIKTSIFDKEVERSKLEDYQEFLLSEIFNSDILEKSKELSESLLKGDSKDIVEARKHLQNKEYVLFGGLKNNFYESLPKFRDKLYARMETEKLFYENPEKVRGKWIGIYIVICIVAFFIVMQFSDKTANYGPLVALILLSIPGAFLAIKMPRRTPQGYSFKRQIEGLSWYLEKGKWRHEVAEKNLFIEEVLPLAIALGVVGKLTKDMAELGVKPPSYMSGVGVHSFSSDFNAFQKGSVNSFFSTPQGKWSGSSSWSGGSGFSGGSSGGGFGGGGGGSW